MFLITQRQNEDDEDARKRKREIENQKLADEEAARAKKREIDDQKLKNESKQVEDEEVARVKKLKDEEHARAKRLKDEEHARVKKRKDEEDAYAKKAADEEALRIKKRKIDEEQLEFERQAARASVMGLKPGSPEFIAFVQKASQSQPCDREAFGFYTLLTQLESKAVSEFAFNLIVDWLGSGPRRRAPWTEAMAAGCAALDLRCYMTRKDLPDVRFPRKQLAAVLRLAKFLDHNVPRKRFECGECARFVVYPSRSSVVPVQFPRTTDHLFATDRLYELNDAWTKRMFSDEATFQRRLLCSFVPAAQIVSIGGGGDGRLLWDARVDQTIEAKVRDTPIPRYHWPASHLYPDARRVVLLKDALSVTLKRPAGDQDVRKAKLRGVPFIMTQRGDTYIAECDVKELALPINIDCDFGVGDHKMTFQTW